MSYGELARVADRVVFSMPTSASQDEPQLHLVTLAADRVDWERTTRYADSARATRYIGTRAEQDYAQLTDTVAQALNDVSLTQDPASRLRHRRAGAEDARGLAAEAFQLQAERSPSDARHAGRGHRRPASSAGLSRFDLSFVAATEAPDHARAA